MGQCTSRFHSFKPVLGRLLLLSFLLAWAAATLTACRRDDSGYFTPPPATIIRAVEETTPVPSTPEPEGQTVETLPPPVSGAPSTEEYPYPPPMPTPEESPTPWVYPTP